MTDLKRSSAIVAFLGAGARRTPLAGDASFRRYERIFKKDETLVLMDAPPEKESVIPFIALARFLRNEGFSAPEVLAVDARQGFLLLEDLGDNTFNRILGKTPDQEKSLYRAAVEVLIHLHKKSPPRGLPVPEGEGYDLPAYDLDTLFRELFLFADWYLPELTGENPLGARAALQEIWEPLFHKIIPENSVLTLRDYHADNLMWLPDRRGFRRVGLLDFQDGVLGHPAYDLVSLLQDARRPYSPRLEAEMIGLYLDGAGIRDREAFLTAYQILGGQRNAKIIGIFTRLWRRDHKPQYPAMIPHVWSLLEENLKHPELKAARAWFDAAVPGSKRSQILG